MKHVLSALAILAVSAAPAYADAPHTPHRGQAPLRFPANHGLNAQRLSPADITSRAQKAGGTVTGNVLRTYADFLASGSYGKRFDTDPLRDVYVVTSSFPNGLTTRHGRWSRATVTTVYDAQTGTVLQFRVTGNVSQSLRPTRR